MNNKKIPLVDLHAQYLSIKDEIDGAIARVINETAFIGGSYVRRFEEEFAAWLGTRHCIGCGNGTDSIEILLKAFGIGPGDEVIVPAHTWISTAEAVNNVGATPIFADTHPRYYTILPEDIRKRLTPRTKAIIPVHLYGLPAEMDEIMEIAREHKLKVLEDCAQAHGALYKGKKVGTIGHAGSFSFYPGKNLGAYGDAGCMVTNDDSVAAASRMIANHGQPKKHTHKVAGRNSRLDGLHAAILSAKLPHLDAWNEARRLHAAEYTRLLEGLKADVVLPSAPDYCRHVFHLYVIQCAGRELLMKALSSAGVECAIHYPSILPNVECYSRGQVSGAGFPNSEKYIGRILSLPMYPELTSEAAGKIAGLVAGSVTA